MGELIEKTVTMGAEEWRAAAAASREHAVKWAFGHNDQSDRLAKAAEMLSAAQVFAGHANKTEMFGESDTANVEHWDLSDEGIEGPPVPA